MLVRRSWRGRSGVVWSWSWLCRLSCRLVRHRQWGWFGDAGEFEARWRADGMGLCLATIKRYVENRGVGCMKCSLFGGLVVFSRVVCMWACGCPGYLWSSAVWRQGCGGDIWYVLWFVSGHIMW